MAVIDVEKSKQISNVKGITKTIDENALTLILDNVQIAQYVYPEASTVRELTSNAIDGQKEKERAIEILTGKAKVEDYYINRDDNDDKYKDSIFNRDYYDLKYLDTEHNKVELSYIVGNDGVGWCDKFIVRDYGVGLGDDRLYGYMQIGYSSKRNTTGLLGGYGLGGKAGLSLRNDYFTTETVHNGRLFKFNCYSYKVDSLIGKFNNKTEEINPSIVFKDGSIIYYETTDSLNYTQITIPCKTHHKDKFKHAVESQLLYFDNISFAIIDKNGVWDRRNVQAEIIYNSENLIIADQHQYSKPHIVVVKDKKSSVGVSYGYCNFKEMEMQDMFGSVGFKCPLRQTMRDNDGNEVVLQDGVDCTPSRESIVWSDATRAYVKNIIEKATLEANKLIEDNLKEEDFLLWIDKAKSILNNTGSNDVLKELARIVDKTQLSPTYQADKSIKFTHIGLMMWGLSVRLNHKSYSYKDKKDDFIRKELEDWYNFDSKNCYFQEGPTQVSKDFYLVQALGSNFITIRIESDEKLLEMIKETEFDEHGVAKPNKWTQEYVNKLKVKRDNIVKHIKASKLYKSYDDVIVPEDWNKKFTEEEGKKISADGESIEKLTPAEVRKLAEQTIVHTLVKQTDVRKDPKPFKWQKNTIKISDLRNDCCNVYYSYGDEDTIPIATVLLWKQYINKKVSTMHLDPEKIKLYRVSKSMPKKFLSNHKHINEFFKIETETSKTMANELVDWTTAKYIKDNIDNLKFMRNYQLFNYQIAELYEEIKQYSLKYYNDNYSDFTDKYPSGKTFIDGMLDYTTKVTDFQLFIREHKDDAEAIKVKSSELFGIDTVTESVGYNLEMYDKMQILLNYSESVRALFNYVQLLVDISKPDINSETEQMIREVIESKGLQGFKIPIKDAVIAPIEKIEPMVELAEVKEEV